MLAFRHADGSNQMGDLAPGAYADYTGYQPVNTVTKVNDPNRWQPLMFYQWQGSCLHRTALGAGQTLQPSFGFNAASRASTLPQYGSKAYKEQADLILNYTANLSDEQKVIAEYWANGPKSETPPGQWHKIAGWVSRRDQMSLDNDLKMFFMLSNAVMDAGITCWECKRYYEYVRPITAIRTLVCGAAGQGADFGMQPALA